MHLSETRLGGILNPPLLWLNRLAAGSIGSSAFARFDSWVMQFTRQG